MVTLNRVDTITETGTPGVLIIACNITTDDGQTFDAPYVYNPSDPYGELTPLLTTWLAANPDFPRLPFVPPTKEELRVGWPPLDRLTFRNKMRAAGVNTAAVTAYLASIADPDEQEEMQVFWEDAQTFQRLDPFVVNLAAHAGKTPDDVDLIFGIGA